MARRVSGRVAPRPGRRGWSRCHCSTGYVFQNAIESVVRPGKGSVVSYAEIGGEAFFGEALASFANCRRRAINAGDIESFARHEPDIRAGTAADFKEASAGAVRNAVEGASNKAHHVLGRVLAPLPGTENLLPRGIGSDGYGLCHASSTPILRAVCGTQFE